MMSGESVLLSVGLLYMKEYNKKFFNLENLNKAWMVFKWMILNKDFNIICDHKVYVDTFERYTEVHQFWMVGD